MISFDLETTRSGGYVFIDRLIISIDDVRFGENGTPSESGLVVGEIETLLKNIERQRQLTKFLGFLSIKNGSEIFEILDDSCWGSGSWDYGALDAPSNPFIFLALPAATELFDGERAYFIGSVNSHSRIIYKAIEDVLIKEVEVDSSEYASAWRSILARILSS